ncbi:aldehyde dehydrogenase, partial [mine drainage metagenome]
MTGPGAELGRALVTHPACSTVTLTGSTASGIDVLKLAAPGVVKCLLELGGKAPVLVAADADLDWAARATVWARFWNVGQACIAAERVYVDEAIHDTFVRKVTDLVGRLTLGPGTRPGTDLGPLCSVHARDQVAKDVAAGVAAGGRVVIGGRAPTDPALARGAFYSPTVVTGVDDANP